MNDDTPITREELLKAEADNNRERLKNRQQSLEHKRNMVYEALLQREEGRMKEAQSYLIDLNLRASFRDNLRARELEEKSNQAEILKRQAEAYRQKLRRYLRPEERDMIETEIAASETI